MYFASRRTLAALLVFALAAALPSRAHARIASSDIIELNQSVQDRTKAPAAVKRIRAFLAEKPDSVYNVFLRKLLLTGLLVGEAPSAQVAGAADTVLKLAMRDPFEAVLINGQVAQYLVNRNELPERALAMSRTAYRGVPPDDRYDPVRGFALGTLGEALLMNNRPDTALVVLQRALEFTADSQRVLARIGRAYEKTKKDDLAIQYYVRASGVFLGQDTTMMAPARALWAKKHGSLSGFDATIEKARDVSRQRVALDTRRHERDPAPAWSLPDLEGKSARLADFKGKVVVMDFWGTWCGPCRQELPIFQEIYERYRGRSDVAFLGVNWERGGSSTEMIDRVRDYMTKNKLSFPCVLDHERTAQMAYEVDGFPTVFLIDRDGKLRFKNVGVAEGIGDILTAQIESLLK